MPKLLMLAGLAGYAAFGQTQNEKPLELTLRDALTRARAVSPQLLSANLAARIAREDAAQAKAALLPTAQAFNQFIYTQPNDTLTGIFVSNDGPHVYNEQLQIHGDIYAPGKWADYRRAIAAEAVARARADLAARGIVATVAQNFYGFAVGQRKFANARTNLDDAQRFLDITSKLEAGGEAAHVDVIKAQIQVEQRERELQDAQLALEKARIALAVLIFPDYRLGFTVVDDLETPTPLPEYPVIQGLASNNNPDIRAAQAAVRQSNYEIASARAGFYPSLSFDYFFGINANQFAIHDPEGHNLLGSVAQAQLTVPLWTWGATRSKVRQAESRAQQARVDLSATQRELLGNLNSFYLEAQAAVSQLNSLRRSVQLSDDNLRLTLLRYQAGESTAQEVVDAQTQLAVARNAYDDGLVRYRLAIANLQTLTGIF